MAQLTVDERLADEVSRFYADPLGFVLFAYPWDTDPSIQICKLPEPWSLVYNSEYGPDAWACEFLDRIGQQVRAHKFDGTHPVEPIKESVVSGHGIGKSAMVAWLVDWIRSTRPDSQGTVTANTFQQLSSKTWAQIAKWCGLSITSHWFDIGSGKGSMYMRHKRRPESWFCNAQTCDETNSEAFAGQHAPTSTSYYLIDEASAVPNKIDEVSDGGLTDGEPMKFAFGNGTRNSGWFKDTQSSRRWGKTAVDSRSCQITNKIEIDKWIEDHGIDSDYIKVRVLGQFPNQSIKQFISETDVNAAEARSLRLEQYTWAPKILTLDNAWEGDDEGVIGLRQGLKFDILRTFKKNDNDVVIATLLAQLEDEHHADAVFIDAGYGTGVASIGTTLGRSWTLVWFATPEPATSGYLNCRARMWGDARDWLKQGGVIPKRQTLHNDLIGPETVPRLDGKIQLESKKDMKKRGVDSPGEGDSLALSFYAPVMAKALQGIPGMQGKQTKEHNPYDDV